MGANDRLFFTDEAISGPSAPDLITDPVAQRNPLHIGLWGVLNQADGHVKVFAEVAPEHIADDDDDGFARYSDDPVLDLSGDEPRFANVPTIYAHKIRFVAEPAADNASGTTLTLTGQVFDRTRPW